MGGKALFAHFFAPTSKSYVFYKENSTAMKEHLSLK
jgi:hypothetical protein